MNLNDDLDTLASLLILSAGVARSIASARHPHRHDIFDLADRIEDAAIELQGAVRKERETLADGGKGVGGR